MPIYMDRHDLSGVTAKDVAQVHQQDLNIQDTYGCKGLTYWFDEERGTAFCLVEAPDMNSVKEMHDHAHGMLPNQIIEVESTVVETFLGRIHDPKPDANVDESGLLILNDPAFRGIMAFELEVPLLEKKINYYQNSENVLKVYHLSIKKILEEFDGREVDHVKDGYLVSFSSVSNTASCALQLLSEIESLNSESDKKMKIRIGISAGVPVTNDKDFFGESIQTARRLCEFAKGGEVLISNSINEYMRDDEIRKLQDQPSLKMFKSEEESFLTEFAHATNSLWNDPEFSVDRFNKKMGLSKSQLYRKTVALTGLSPNDYMKEYRLKRSLKRLTELKGNISEIAYDSGFSSPSYFSKCFQKRFGISPSDYLNSKK